MSHSSAVVPLPIAMARLACVLAGGLSAPVLAGPDVAGAVGRTGADEAARPVTFSLRALGELGFNAGLKDSAGDVTVSRVGAELGAGIPIGDRSNLDLSFRYEYSNYDFRGATGLVPGTGDPFQDVHREILMATFSREQTEQWSWFVGGDAVLAGEDGADVGSSLTGGVFGGATYAFSDNFSLGLGAWFQSGLEDDAFFLPVPLVNWKIAEEWRLSTENRPGLVLIYTPSERWSFRAGGFWEYRDVRLSRTGSLPDGAVTDSRLPIGAGVVYSPSESVSVRFDAGVYAAQQYKVFNDEGDEISKVKSDVTPFVMFSLVYRF